MAAGKGIRKNRRLQRKYKNLILELKYLYSELEFHEEELEGASISFQKALAAYCEEHKIDLFAGAAPAPQAPNTSDSLEILESEIVEIKNKDLKKIFKMIALVCHPDKLLELSEKEQKEKTDLFIKAQQEAKAGNLYKLSQIAIELEIKLPPPRDSQLKLLQKEALEVQNKINQASGTYAWAWSDEDDEGKREDLLKNYVDLMHSIASKAKANEEED
tara:strand:+ start:1720 stop:2370 length:651 start_codon:yes stop_codon:yes gene_type:complete